MFLEKKKYFIVSDLTKCRAAIFACESCPLLPFFREKGRKQKIRKKLLLFFPFNETNLTNL